MTKKFIFVCVLAIILLSNAVSAFCEDGYPWRDQVVMKSEAATVVIDLGGGAFSDFHVAGSDLNPLSWRPPDKSSTSPASMGHFICFDRWGQASEAETANGMPFHGEASNVMWKVISSPVPSGGKTTASVGCTLPMGGLSLERTVELSAIAPVMTVSENITNNNTLGRIYNIVQHPSIGPPFLDQSVIVDCNAYKGIIQGQSWPRPDSCVIYWPELAYNGKYVNLRHLGADHDPGVTSFVFPDESKFGWVTACNSAKNLLIGYIWNLGDYPWLSIWRNSRDNLPAARGLEFGTTGLHRPFGDMVECGPVFDTPLFEYLDAGETVTKSYIAFLAEIPSDFEGVGSVEKKNNVIVIIERKGRNNRTIELKFQ